MECRLWFPFLRDNVVRFFFLMSTSINVALFLNTIFDDFREIIEFSYEEMCTCLFIIKATFRLVTLSVLFYAATIQGLACLEWKCRSGI